MTTKAGSLITSVLQRVRDPQGAFHSRDFTRETLARAEKLTNAILELVISSATLSTSPRRLLYPVDVNFPSSLRILGVRHNNRDLYRITTTELQAICPNWVRDTGDQFEAFALFGRDVLALYPGIPRSSEVTVTYVVDTEGLASENTELALPKHALPIATDITEILLLLRQKDFAQAAELTTKLKTRLDAING